MGVPLERCDVLPDSDVWEVIFSDNLRQQMRIHPRPLRPAVTQVLREMASGRLPPCTGGKGGRIHIEERIPKSMFLHQWLFPFPGLLKTQKWM